jgi:hypothetical protein
VNTPLTLTATASSGLPVAYNASPATVCTVSGTTATFATAGTCTIVASQAGNNSSYAAATPVSQTFAVNNGNGGGGGGSGSSSTASASYQGPPDAGTQGAWPGKYGASGYQIANVNTQAAPNVNVAVTGAATYTWAPQSTDPRALMASPSATTGIASQFFGNSFSINVSITDGHTYPVALYLLDYDGYSRSETITVTTADGSNTPLGPSQTFSNFHNGVWAVWNISGSVIIQVTNALSYGNATVSGVFIGTDPPNQYSILQINAGGGANGTWLADEYYSGGTTYSVSSAISTANVSNPAPQGVYQSQRSASVGTQSNETLVYTIPNLVAGAPYTVHLHFAEIYWQSAGQRVFNVVINSNLVLQNFDIIAAAGCANCAIVKSFAATADSNGNITITFQPVKDLPAINGIEIAPVQVTLLLSNGQWLTQNLGQSGTAEFISSAGIAASGDYDGDGLIDPVTFVSSSAPPTFNATLSSNGATFPYYLGIAGDVAVPGDYDGDGKTDFAVFRPSDSHWYYVPSGTPGGSPVGVPTQELSSDIPLPGDYDGDGKTDIVYFRPGTATFYFTVLSATPGVTHNPITLGKLGDVPVVGDYDGDGRTDLAVFRPSTGEWAYLLSSNPNVVRTQLTQGLPGDVAVPGDYDGDGRTDFAFWRPSNQTWYVILTSNPGQTFNSKFTGTSNNIGDLNYATPFSLAPFAKAPGVNLAARQTANSQYTISGTVLLPDGATPLQGVAVTASTQYSSLQVTTDKAGAYSFTLPANSTLTLSLSLANYTFSSSLYATSPGPMLSGNVAQNFTATVSGTPGTPMSQTISFPSIPTQTVGTPLSLNASASSGLTVMFRSDTTSVCTVNGATASFLMAGTCTIEASQSGNSSYAPATSVPETFTVSAVLVPGSLNPTAPLKEYIFLNGQVIAIEHAH